MANLVTYPESFDNAIWTKTGTLTADAAVAPDGTTTADKLETILVGSNCYWGSLGNALDLTGGLPYTWSIFAKRGTTQYAYLYVPACGAVIYDVLNGTVVTSGEWGVAPNRSAPTAYGINAQGGGWFRLWFTGTPPNDINDVGATFGPSDSTSLGTWTSDPGDYLYFWGALFEQSAALSSYGSVSGWSSGYYSGFDTGGAWRIRQWEKTLESFTLKLEEPKARLKTKIPTTLFDRATYPNISEDKIGDPVPIAYGQIYGAEAICTDPSTRTFKVAGHAINGFDSVRVEDSANKVWNGAAFGSPNLTNATFQLTEAEWDGKSRVAVDFRGKEISAGVVMDSAADVVNDILTVEVGIPTADVEATTLAESNAKLEIGTDRYGKQYNHRRLGVYLDEQLEALEVIEAINSAVGSYLFVDHDGTFRYVVFEPEPGNGLTLFDESSVFSFAEETESMDVVSQVRVKYRENRALDSWQSAVATDAKAQYLTGATAPITDERELPVYREADADYIAGRTVRMEGRRRKTYRMKCSHIAFPLLPGDFVKVELTRGGIDAVFEVLERKINLPGLSIELRLGDLHGLRNESGFWVSDSPTFPASLGGASCAVWDKNWSAEQKAWAKQNVGFWTDDNGFADPTDPDSFMLSVWV